MALNKINLIIRNLPQEKDTDLGVGTNQRSLIRKTNKMKCQKCLNMDNCLYLEKHAFLEFTGGDRQGVSDS